MFKRRISAKFARLVAGLFVPVFLGATPAFAGNLSEVQAIYDRLIYDSQNTDNNDFFDDNQWQVIDTQQYVTGVVGNNANSAEKTTCPAYAYCSNESGADGHEDMYWLYHDDDQTVSNLQTELRSVMRAPGNVRDNTWKNTFAQVGRFLCPSNTVGRARSVSGNGYDPGEGCWCWWSKRTGATSGYAQLAPKVNDNVFDPIAYDAAYATRNGWYAPCEEPLGTFNIAFATSGDNYSSPEQWTWRWASPTSTTTDWLNTAILTGGVDTSCSPDAGENRNLYLADIMVGNNSLLKEDAGNFCFGQSDVRALADSACEKLLTVFAPNGLPYVYSLEGISNGNLERLEMCVDPNCELGSVYDKAELDYSDDDGLEVQCGMAYSSTSDSTPHSECYYVGYHDGVQYKLYPYQLDYLIDIFTTMFDSSNSADWETVYNNYVNSNDITFVLGVTNNADATLSANCGAGGGGGGGTTTEYTCNAGNYLPANSTSCSVCVAGNYCPGGTWEKSSSAQGLNPCPNGYTSAGGVSSLSECGPKQYTITYNLDGGTNAASNPTTYTVETPTITLADPTKTGYTFDGWYTEAAFTNKVTQIAKGATGDKTLYAKWTANGVKCAAGYYLPANGSTCVICPAGKYCPGGTYIPSTSDQGADACPPDYGAEKETEVSNVDSAATLVEYGFAPDVTGISSPDECTVDAAYSNATGSWIERRKFDSVVDLLYNTMVGTYYFESMAGYYLSGVNTKCMSAFGAGPSDGVVYSSIKKCDAGYYCPATASAYENNATVCGGTNNPTTLGRTQCATGYTSTAGATACTPITYKVTLDKQSGTGGTSEYYYQYNTKGTCYYYTSSALSACTDSSDGQNITKPTRTGYTFGGYWTGKNGTGTMYVDSTGLTKNNLYTAVAGNTTLYAKWTVVEYSITYNLNGGTNAAGAKTSYTIETADYTLPTPTKKGYDFGGWYENSGMAGNAVTKIAAGSTGAKTFWAKFTPMKIYCNPGKYLVAGATVCDTECPAGSMCAGGEVTYTGTEQGRRVCPAGTFSQAGANTCTKCLSGAFSATDGATACTPCAAGTTNDGWGNTKCDIQCANSAHVLKWMQSTWSIGNGSMGQVVAGECEIESCATGYESAADASSCTATEYAITYNLDGGTNNASNPAKYTIETATITLADPTRTGYTFGGWYSDAAFTTQATKIAKGSTGAKTFYAKWTVVEYNITYNLDGGTNNASNPTKYTVETATITLAAPTKTGYTFGGWYTNSGLTGNAVTQIAKGSTGNKTFWAKWTLSSVTCAAGKYLPANSLSCTKCTAGHACPGGTFEYKNTDQGITQCTGATYAGAGASECTMCPWPYNHDKSAGKTKAEQCTVQTSEPDSDTGWYIKDAKGDKVFCPTGYYCPSAIVAYGSTNSPTACPAIASHTPTTWPSNYRNPTVENSSSFAHDGSPTAVTGCMVQYLLKNDAGKIFVLNYYNPQTQKYDIDVGSNIGYNGYYMWYVSLNPGYYFTKKWQYTIDGTTMDWCQATSSSADGDVPKLYQDVAPCPAGSYCPGYDEILDMFAEPPVIPDSWPKCGDGEYNDINGINACPTPYPNSATKSSKIEQCYLTTTAGKYVATARADQVQCLANNYCTGGTKVNYGSTGGMQSCAMGYESAAGASSCTATEYAITYNLNGGTNNASNPATYTIETATITLAAPTKTGYTFGGWYTNSGLTGNAVTQIAKGSTGNKTFWAKWTVKSVTCAAGKYLPANSLSCGDCDAGYACPGGIYSYSSSIQGRTQCTGRTKYSASGAATCATVAAGYYATGCDANGNGCAGQSQCTGTTYCSDGVKYDCPFGYTTDKSDGKTAASQCTISVAAGKYLDTAKGTATTSCAAGSYKGAHTVNYGSTSSCGPCPTDYPYSDAGSSSSGQCYKNGTSTGTRSDPTLPTGCVAQTTTACTPGTCTYRIYKSGTTTSCTPTNCVNTHKACTSASADYYLDSGVAKACNVLNSAYPKSDGGNITSSSCYGTFSKSGTQVNGTTPTNCSAVTAWNACTPGTCNYTKYASGTIKTDCTPTDCTKTVKTVTAKSGYYVNNNTSCSACSGLAGGFYPNSASDNTGGASVCYTNSISGKYVAAANATSAIDCAAGTYKGAHTVNYGDTSSCASCATGYESAAGASSCSAITYSITYNLNGGTNAVANPATYTVETETITLAVPTKTGYTFGGWYSDAALKTQVTQIAKGSTGNKTLYAKWSGNTYTVTLNANGGTGGTASVTATYNEQMPTLASVATMADFALVGYFDATTGGTKYYNADGTGARVWDKTSDATLYAQWLSDFISVKCDAGKYISTGATVCSATCVAGNYCLGGTFTIPRTGATIDTGINGCTGRTKYSAAGAASCSTVSSGYYTTGCDANDKCTGQSQCTDATYCSGGIKYDCPTAYTANIDAGKTADTQCQIKCAAGNYVSTAQSDQTTCTAGAYCPGDVLVNWGGIGGRTLCTAGTYNPNTGSSLATACVKSDAGYYVDTNGATAQTACTGATYTDAAGATKCTTCPTATKYADALARYSYYNTGAIGDHTTKTKCQAIFNSRIDHGTLVNDACYLGSDNDYGTSTSTGASTCWLLKDGLSCDGGYYNKSQSASTRATVLSNACIAVGAGYWSATGGLTRTQCGSGLTTIGYGAGADEAGDCGRILSYGNKTVYLRSVRKTTPSLNVWMDGRTYYGNVAAGDVSGRIRVRRGDTTYSVYDDSMQ